MSAGHITRIVEKEGGIALVIALLVMLVGTAIGIFGVTTGVIETRITGLEREYNIAFYGGDSGRHFAHEIMMDALDQLQTPQQMAYNAPMPLDWDEGGTTTTTTKTATTSTSALSSASVGAAAGGGGGGGPEDGAQRLVITLDQNFHDDTFKSDNETVENDTIRTNPTTAPDIQVTVQGYVEEKGMWVDQRRIDIDVDKRENHPTAGGGIEFSSGYDGIGSGGSGAGGIVAIYDIYSLGTYTPSNARAIISTVFRKPVGISAGGGTSK